MTLVCLVIQVTSVEKRRGKSLGFRAPITSFQCHILQSTNMSSPLWFGIWVFDKYRVIGNSCPTCFCRSKKIKKLKNQIICQALLNSPLSLNTGMVYCKISPDMKVRALELLQEGWEIEEVVEVLNVSAKSVGHWTNNLNAHGCVDLPSV
jgi:hypothetical protein